MTVERITDPEGCLLNVLYEISPLEWRKYQPRYPRVWVGDQFERIDGSACPPYISFRFEDENEAVIARLRQALEGYSGRILWVLNEHKRDGLSGTNWTIEPSRLLEVKERAIKLGLTSDQYLVKYEPEFGPTAYDDLEDLTEHIRQAFPDRDIPASVEN
jgi:hypothetical protein